MSLYATKFAQSLYFGTLFPSAAAAIKNIKKYLRNS